MSTKTDTIIDTKTNKNMTDNKTENTNDKNDEITSHNQIDPSITHQYLRKKYTEKEMQIGCYNFFFKWNPPTIQNPTPNVKRLFKHMERFNWDNDDIKMDLMNYLFCDRKLIKEVMSDIDEMEEEIIKENPKFDEDDIFDQLNEGWYEYWETSDLIEDTPLIPLWVNFISVFYPTLYNEYIQYLINGENITDEYVSGYGEDILKKWKKKMEEENNKEKKESKETVNETVEMVG
jgi:hypothetical protein